MNELALFAGSGGGILGGHLLGWRTIAAVEIEDYPRRVLLQRQADGLLPRFPIWDDICTFDGHPWRGKVDVISGGFPCQDISAAGKGDGLDGERSGLWTEMARLVGEIRPPFVFVENSPMLTSRGGVRVIADLTSLGYDTKWTVMGAADVGAPHQRDRMWIVGKAPHAHFIGLQRPTHKRILESKGSSQLQVEQPRNQGKVGKQNPRQREFLSHPQHDRDGWREQQQESSTQEDGDVANTCNQGLWSCGRGNGGEFDAENREWSDNQTRGRTNVKSSQFGKSQNLEEKVSYSTSIRPQGQREYEQSINSTQNGDWKANILEPIGTPDQWSTEPELGRVADGVAHRVDRLKAIGNGQVPLCAASAWRLLTSNW